MSLSHRYIVRMDRKDSVFLLEDSDERIRWFRDRFPDMVVADKADQAIAILSQKQFDWVFLDHDLSLLDCIGRTVHETGTGKDVAKFLSGAGWIGHNVIIHSWNPVGAAAMKDLLEGAVAIPFGQFEIEFI